jgi:hypothetical protein
MQASRLIPHNCMACRFWTATEVVRTSTGWTLQCTHCGRTMCARGNERAFHRFLTSIEHFQFRVRQRFPCLAALNVRGAHVSYPDSRSSMCDASEVSGDVGDF